MPGDLTKPPTGRHISPLRVVRRPAAAAALICGIAVAGAGATGLALASQTGRPAAPAPKPTFTSVPVGSQELAPQPEIQAVAKPVSLDIPAIGVRSGLVRLGLTSSGALQVPSTPAVAGWYTGSARPGAIGAAVIVGHVDSRSGPGIFYQLSALHPGDKVYVRRADGSLAVFQVTSVRSYLKSQFPTLTVYGPVPYAELRLITCGGTFDFATGHYLSNTIVYASLVH
jgi:sortase (surface protein transpeptidase)